MPYRRQLTNWQMFNINFGYLGIQFAWALQFANISGVFKFLGASDDQIPILWLAGPVCGLLIPPVIGYLSDHTWVGFLGRRRFYICLGTLIAAFSLLAIPNIENLTHALVFVWLLDAGLNMAMHPYRALIADKTPVYQQTKCFSFLTIASCVGSALAFLLPWMLAFFIGSKTRDSNLIPFTIETAFIIGCFTLVFTSLWTVMSTSEQRIINSNDEELKDKSSTAFNIKIKDYLILPEVMQDLIKVEFFSWIGMFSFIIYFALGIAQNIFNLPQGVDISDNPMYSEMMQKGVEYCGLFSFFYIIVSSIFVVFLARLANKYQRKNIYSICLLVGAIGLIICSSSYNILQMTLGVVLIGLAWGAVVTIPFAILSSGVPKDKTGWYMGYYNLFVVIPQILVSCTFGFIIRVFFDDNAMAVIFIGGVSMICAAVFAYRIRDPLCVVDKSLESDISENLKIAS